jgi:hypothetical protein
MKRARALRAGLTLTTLVVFASACTFQVNLNGIAFTQENVEKTIDEKLPTEYHQVAPDLPLGHAKCPDGLWS